MIGNERAKRRLGASLLASVALLAACARKDDAKFRTEKVTRGDVTATVSATGSLSAVTTVNVGSQVSGIIARLHADFNSQVKKGQLLAELDPTPFQQSVEQRRADVTKANVELRSAEVSLTRAKNLFQQQLLAQSDLDAAQTARDAAAAAVAQAQAALKQAETNLGYSKITSPIEGVVVSRSYDVGQTVAASFQAPTLFQIAQDLTKMQVLTNIDESDVGQIREGQIARFTVDAFPDGTFKGTVAQVRLSPQVVQNVVTYPVMLDVPNPDLKLKPGMTANVVVPVDVRRGTLRVPNSALRFRAATADLVPAAAKEREEREKAAKAGATAPPAATATTATTAPATASPATAAPAPAETGRRGPGGPGGGGGWSGRPGGGAGGGPGGAGGGRRAGGSRSGEVFVLEAASGKLRPAKVKSSITDGNLTAVESEELKEGDDVVIGLATSRAGDLSGGGGRPGGGAPRPRM